MCLTALALMLLALTACASDRTSTAIKSRLTQLPGDAQTYSFGVVQNTEYFAEHIEFAQRDYSMGTADRIWFITRAGRAPSTIGGLRAYYMLSVRWQLKDGRQFILEDIDVGAIMRAFFATHSIVLQHQREGRAWMQGDYDPSLVHEIRGDSVAIRWLLTMNKTPMTVRLSARSATTTRMVFEEEEIPVIILKGRATGGIDFDKRYEARRAN